jgi:uncharacterized protein DUF2730
MNELLPVISVAVAIGSFAYTIWATSSKKHSKQIEDIQRSVAQVETQVVTVQHSLEIRVDRVEDRATRLESDVRHLPDKDITHRLELHMTKISGEVSRLAESIKPISAISQRVQDIIIEKVASQ